MENASRALLMAASVLVAIIIISTLVFMYNKLTNIPDEQENTKLVQQIDDFNKVYESYNRKDVYGTQLASLVNRMLDNNKKYSYSNEEESYKMDMVVIFKIQDDYFGKGETYDLNGIKSKMSTLQTKEESNKAIAGNSERPFTDFKRKLFKCTGIEYNEKTARVAKLYFEEVDPTSDEYQIKKK